MTVIKEYGIMLYDNKSSFENRSGIISLEQAWLKEINRMKDSREYFDSIVLKWGRIREGYFSSAVRDKDIELA